MKELAKLSWKELLELGFSPCPDCHNSGEVETTSKFDLYRRYETCSLCNGLGAVPDALVQKA